MRALVTKEAYQARWILALAAGLVALAAFLRLSGVVAGSAEFEGEFGAIFTLVLALAVGFRLPQMGFAQDERGHTVVFLRSLPVSPWHIVGARFLFLTLVEAAAVGGLAAAGFPVGGFLWAGSAVAAFSLLMCYFFGVKGATTAVVVAMVVLNVLGVAILVAGKSNPGILASVEAAKTHLAELSASPALSAAVGLGLLALTFLVSGYVFARRDISRLP